jgi:hypothetical protein
MIRVLNVPSAVQRWQLTVNELERVGICDYERFEAIADIGPHQSFNRSVNKIICDFFFSDKRNLLLLEDDVIFLDLNYFDAALNELPADWDILYLGANVAENSFDKPIRYSPHLCRVFNAWTTHAVAFNRSLFIRELIIHQPGYSVQMFDNWLSGQLHRCKAFCISPMIAIQRPGNSYIWGGDANYTSVFDHSNDILKNA